MRGGTHEGVQITESITHKFTQMKIFDTSKYIFYWQSHQTTFEACSTLTNNNTPSNSHNRIIVVDTNESDGSGKEACERDITNYRENMFRLFVFIHPPLLHTTLLVAEKRKVQFIRFDNMIKMFLFLHLIWTSKSCLKYFSLAFLIWGSLSLIFSTPVIV